MPYLPEVFCTQSIVYPEAKMMFWWFILANELSWLAAFYLVQKLRKGGLNGLRNANTFGDGILFFINYKNSVVF